MPRWPDDPSWLGPPPAARPEPVPVPHDAPTRGASPRPAPPPVVVGATPTALESGPGAGRGPPLPVDAIGPYQLSGAIGQGGMGVVYRGRAPDGREVALKVLVPPFGDGDRVGRFHRERRLLLGLSETEGFVPLLDFGESALGPFLVMPFVPGGTLRGRLNQGPMAVEVAVGLMRQVAAAVGRAHERGVVHRDLKPENVLFSAEGRPLVADLGLAKHLRQGTWAASTIAGPRTASKAFMGTIGYAAPEQMADGRSVGPPADVFALGAILYECLAGAPPFVAQNVVDLVRRIDKADYPPLDSVRRTPPRLAELVARALAREPAQRFEDARALERALAGCLEGAAPGVLGPLQGQETLELPPAPRPTPPASGKLAHDLPDTREGSRGGAPPPALAPTPAPGGRERERGSDEDTLGDDDAAPAAASPARSQQQTLVLGVLIGATAALAAAALAVGLAVLLRGPRPPAPATEPPPPPPATSKVATEAAPVHPAGPARRDPEEARRQARRAAEAWQAGDAPAALDAATRAIAADPGLVVAWAVRARVRLVSGEAQGAFDDATQAVGLDRDHGPAWAVRAAVLEARGELRGAHDEADRAVGLAPQDPLGWHVRASVALRQSQWDRAIFDATHALERGAPTAALLVRARAWLGKGQRPRALADLDEAVTQDPADPDALRARGRLRLELGEPAAALDDLDRALAAREADAEAHALRGQALLTLGRPDDALRAGQRAQALAPDDPGPPAVVAAAQAALGDLPAALATLDAAQRRWPTHTPLYHQRGLLRREAREWRGASADLAIAAREQPRDATLQRLLGETRAEAGDAAGALEALETFLALAPDDPEAGRIRALLETLKR